MPFLVLERVRNVAKLVRQSGQSIWSFPIACYAIDVLDIFAAVIFLRGSICFLPGNGELDVFIHGCFLFVVGSAIYTVICAACLAETISEKGVHSFEAWENSLYIAGSLAFLAGTYLYWPSEMALEPLLEFRRRARNQNTDVSQLMRHALQSTDRVEENSGHQQLGDQSISLRRISLGQYNNLYDRQWLGSLLFVFGSVCFALASFVNAMSQLNQRRFVSWTSIMLSAITSLYMLGSLQFIVGSICFMPEVSDDAAMARFGAWNYISGSVFFLIGGLISLIRTHLVITGASPQEKHETSSLLSDGQGQCTPPKDQSFSESAPCVSA